jgi:hypothetical protein
MGHYSRLFSNGSASKDVKSHKSGAAKMAASPLAAALGPPCSGILSSLRLHDNSHPADAIAEDSPSRSHPRLLCLRQGSHHDFDFELHNSAPVQIRKIDELGAAHAAGALEDDYVLSINGKPVDHLDAKTVLPLLKTKESHIKMLVIQPDKGLPYAPLRREFMVKSCMDAMGFSWHDEDCDCAIVTEATTTPEPDAQPSQVADGVGERSPEAAAKLWASSPSNLHADNISFQQQWQELLLHFNELAGKL